MCVATPAQAAPAATRGTPIFDKIILQLDDEFTDVNDFLTEKPETSGLIMYLSTTAAVSGQAGSSPPPKRPKKRAHHHQKRTS